MVPTLLGGRSGACRQGLTVSPSAAKLGDDRAEPPGHDRSKTLSHMRQSFAKPPVYGAFVGSEFRAEGRKGGRRRDGALAVGPPRRPPLRRIRCCWKNIERLAREPLPWPRSAARAVGARGSRRFTVQMSQRVRTCPKRPTLKRHKCRAPCAAAATVATHFLNFARKPGSVPPRSARRWRASRSPYTRTSRTSISIRFCRALLTILPSFMSSGSA